MVSSVHDAGIGEPSNWRTSDGYWLPEPSLADRRNCSSMDQDPPDPSVLAAHLMTTDKKVWICDQHSIKTEQGE